MEFQQTHLIIRLAVWAQNRVDTDPELEKIIKDAMETCGLDKIPDSWQNDFIT